jgi:hypothetical protein
MKTFKQWLNENINATLYKHSDSKGASIETDDNHDWDKENIQPIDINQIINYEPKSKMLNPKSTQNKENIKNAILNKQKLPPVLLRQINTNQYPKLRNPSHIKKFTTPDFF